MLKDLSALNEWTFRESGLYFVKGRRFESWSTLALLLLRKGHRPMKVSRIRKEKLSISKINHTKLRLFLLYFLASPDDCACFSIELTVLSLWLERCIFLLRSDSGIDSSCTVWSTYLLSSLINPPLLNVTNMFLSTTILSTTEVESDEFV